MPDDIDHKAQVTAGHVIAVEIWKQIPNENLPNIYSSLINQLQLHVAINPSRCLLF